MICKARTHTDIYIYINIYTHNSSSWLGMSAFRAKAPVSWMCCYDSLPLANTHNFSEGVPAFKGMMCVAGKVLSRRGPDCWGFSLPRLMLMFERRWNSHTTRPASLHLSGRNGPASWPSECKRSPCLPGKAFLVTKRGWLAPKLWDCNCGSEKSHQKCRQGS